MGDQSVSSGATVFDTAGRGIEADLGQELRLDDIRRALSIPSEPRTKRGIPAEVRSALPRLAAAGSAAEPLIQRGTASACFEMHMGLFAALIQVAVDLSTIYPYTILGGQVTFPGGVEVSQWRVTGGHFGLRRRPVSDPTVLLEDELIVIAQLLPPTIAQLLPPTSEVAEAELTHSAPPTVLIIGYGRPPLSYPGLYVTPSGLYYHNTLFKGWHTCP
jgi:hypothetical protein